MWLLKTYLREVFTFFCESHQHTVDAKYAFKSQADKVIHFCSQLQIMPYSGKVLSNVCQVGTNLLDTLGIDDARLVGGQGLYDGIIELKSGGTWAPICDYYTGSEIFSAVCNTIG